MGQANSESSHKRYFFTKKLTIFFFKKCIVFEIKKYIFLNLQFLKPQAIYKYLAELQNLYFITEIVGIFINMIHQNIIEKRFK